MEITLSTHRISFNTYHIGIFTLVLLGIYLLSLLIPTHTNPPYLRAIGAGCMAISFSLLGSVQKVYTTQNHTSYHFTPIHRITVFAIIFVTVQEYLIYHSWHDTLARSRFFTSVITSMFILHRLYKHIHTYYTTHSLSDTTIGKTSSDTASRIHTPPNTALTHTPGQRSVYNTTLLAMGISLTGLIIHPALHTVGLSWGGLYLLSALTLYYTAMEPPKNTAKSKIPGHTYTGYVLITIITAYSLGIYMYACVTIAHVLNTPWISATLILVCCYILYIRMHRLLALYLTHPKTHHTHVNTIDYTYNSGIALGYVTLLILYYIQIG